MARKAINRTYNPGSEYAETTVRGHQKAILDMVAAHPGINRMDLIAKLEETIETKMKTGVSGLLSYYEKSLIEKGFLVVTKEEAVAEAA